MRIWRRATAGAAASALLAIAIWYATGFLPYLGALQGLSARGLAQVHHADPVRAFVLQREAAAQIRGYAIRQVYSSLVHEGRPSSMLAWHANHLFWYAASYLHLEDDEVYGIWLACTLGCERGLAQVSSQYLGKPLQTLSVDEVARLMAIVRYPANDTSRQDSGTSKSGP